MSIFRRITTAPKENPREPAWWSGPLLLAFGTALWFFDALPLWVFLPMAAVIVATTAWQWRGLARRNPGRTSM